MNKIVLCQDCLSIAPFIQVIVVEPGTIIIDEATCDTAIVDDQTVQKLDDRLYCTNLIWEKLKQAIDAQPAEAHA